MTSVATGIGVCCAVGLNLAAAFAQQAPPLPNPKPPLQTSAKSTEAEVTLTGCLVQGSTANVFVLRDAKRDPASVSEKAARYVVVPAAEDLVLKQHLNHVVRILGVPDGRPQPTPQAGSPVDEKLIPALSAKSLTMVSPSCGTGSGGNWGAADGVSAGSSGHGSPHGTGGGSIGLGAGGGFFGSGASSLASTTGRAGARSATGSSGLYGGIGFAQTSSVTGGAFIEGAPADRTEQESEFDDVLDWVVPTSGNLFDGPGAVSQPVFEHVPAFAAANAAVSEPPSVALDALMSHVERTTATELLGEDAPAAESALAPMALDTPLVNPEPGTLLLIATGLLLVMYAGRRRDWKAFGRRSSR